MAIRWKSKIILFKPEASYGVDPTPLAANGILMTGVTLEPMRGEDVSRDLELPYLGGQAMIPTGLHVQLRGRVELMPSGAAGTAPAWGPLLRAAGVAQTINVGVSVVYNPITDNQESGHTYFWIGDTRHKIAGCRVDATAPRFNAQGIVYSDFTITGLYVGPAEAARVLPTLTAFQKPLIASKANTPTFTINAVPMVLRSFQMAFHNQVEPRLLVGLEEIVIVDRAEQISATVQAVPLTSFDPYALAAAQTLVPVSLVHGTQAGLITSFLAPTCQLQRLSGLENQQNILEWPLVLNPLPASGNDQWTLTLT